MFVPIVEFTFPLYNDSQVHIHTLADRVSQQTNSIPPEQIMRATVPPHPDLSSIQNIYPHLDDMTKLCCFSHF